MNIDVLLGDKQQLEAKFNQYSVLADASVSNGGEAKYPEPADYFFVALALCAGYYARVFCETRAISTKGLKIQQSNQTIGELKYKKGIHLSLVLPEKFPEKYKQGIIASIENCTVKKIIEASPEFSIELI